MAAEEIQDDALRRWREERIRFEILALLHGACSGKPGCILRLSSFVRELGAWNEQLMRAFDFLDGRGYIVLHGAGPTLVSITRKGLDYVEQDSGRRRSVRD